MRKHLHNSDATVLCLPGSVMQQLTDTLVLPSWETCHLPLGVAKILIPSIPASTASEQNAQSFSVAPSTVEDQKLP